MNSHPETTASIDRRSSVVSARKTGNRVEVGFGDGATRELHLLWLRDNCRCAACWHPSARERAFDVMTLPPEMADGDVSITPAGALAVTWSGDGHRSLFDAQWLLESTSTRPPRPRRRPWGAELAGTIPVLAYDDVMGTDEGLLAWCRHLRDDGIAIVRGAPCDPMEVARIGRRIGFVWTHYPGEIHDVRPRVAPDSLAYTRLPLPLHTDLPSRVSPPGIQLLHCLVNDASGGDTLLADGLRVANTLRETEPELYRVLSEQRVEFRFASDTVDYRCEALILEHDADGEIRMIRYNSPLITPPYLASERMELWYRAYRAFLALASDERHLVRTRFQTGDVICLDNHRILHGRTAFDPESGARHLRCCYIDRDELTCRLRVLGEGHRVRERVSA